MNLFVLTFLAWTPYEKSSSEIQGVYTIEKLDEYKSSGQLNSDLQEWAKNQGLTWHENIESETEEHTLNS